VRPALHAAWDGACVVAILLLVGARWLRYSRWSELPGLDGLTRELMVLDAQAFLWPWVYSTMKLRIVLLALVVLVVGFHRRLLPHLVARVDGTWRLTPLAVSSLLGAMLWFQYLFDSNLTMAVVCASSLVLVWLAEHARVAARLPRNLLLAVWLAFFGAWLVAAGDPVERVAIAAWRRAARQPSLARRSRPPPRPGPRRLAAIGREPFLPAPARHAAARRHAPRNDLAYDFCEVPGRDSVRHRPRVRSVLAGYEDCRTGA
jgi:hypothetical protein